MASASTFSSPILTLITGLVHWCRWRDERDEFESAKANSHKTFGCSLSASSLLVIEGTVTVVSC